MATQTKRVLVTIGTGFEEIETITTVDVLRRAQIETVLVSVHGKDHPLLLKGRGGIHVQCDGVSTIF